MRSISSALGASFLALCSSCYATATAPGDYFLTVDETAVQLSPSKQGKTTNTLFKRQKVSVLEVTNGWARISKYYDGTSEGVQGQVARWVQASTLSKDRPSDEKADGADQGLIELIKESDNFAKFKKPFVNASKKLIAEKTCSMQDFKEYGGWMKSTNYSNGKVYFTYCGGMSKSDRIYVDVSTGKVFR